MEGLISTVRDRYGRMVSYYGLFTLAYREKTVQKNAEHLEDRHKIGILRLMRPQLQAVSTQLHEEFTRLLDRREKLLTQTVTRSMPQMLGKSIAQLRSDSLKLKKAQTEKISRLEKRIELVNADTGARLKAIQKQLERHRADEKTKEREREREQTEQAIKSRDTRQRQSRDQSREQDEMRRDISADIYRTERRVYQKLRDEQEYEKRRRG